MPPTTAQRVVVSLILPIYVRPLALRGAWRTFHVPAGGGGGFERTQLTQGGEGGELEFPTKNNGIGPIIMNLLFAAWV